MRAEPLLQVLPPCASTGPAQPAKGELATRRISNRQLAQAYGASEHWIGRVLNGHVPPSRRFRSFLADYLDVPEDRLFVIVEHRAAS